MRHFIILATVLLVLDPAFADKPAPGVQPKMIREIRVGGRMAEAFAYDPASKLLVTAGWEYTDDENDPDTEAWKTGLARGVLQLWDPANGKHIAKFQGAAGAFLDVAVSPDGTLVATAGRRENDSEAGEVKLWDLQTRKAKKTTFQGNTHWVLCTAFSPDGKWLATGGFDKRAKVWDVASGKLITTLPQHSSYVQIVKFTKDGKTLLTADRKGGVTLWDTAQWGQNRGQIKVDGLFLLDAQLSRDESKLALAGQNGPELTAGQVRIWDITSMKETAVLKTRTLTCAAAFSPNGKWIAAHGLGRELKLFNIATQQNVSITHSGGSSGEMVTFLPDGTLAFTCRPGVVALWNPGVE